MGLLAKYKQHVRGHGGYQIRKDSKLMEVEGEEKMQIGGRDQLNQRMYKKNLESYHFITN